MTPIEPLRRTYTHARQAFLAAADDVGAEVTTDVHPLDGPAGEELAVDVAWTGPRAAQRVLLVVSATHGVEGFAGSALQSHWLAHHVVDQPDDVAVVHVHAFNPYGFAWVRRVNEDNVDLNRNFVDWDHPPPTNADYGRLADALVPERWDDESRGAAVRVLAEATAEFGMAGMQQVVSGGQYDHPTGIFYGGAGPVWSHRWLRGWAADTLSGVAHLGVVDLHTGLGPWGHGELISHEHAGSPGYQRATAWWDEVRSQLDGESVSASLTGDWLGVVGQLAPNAEITAAALEFGTVDTLTVLDALRADAWLHAHGDPRSPDATEIRAQLRAAFADDDPAWLEALWERFAWVAERALTNLTDVRTPSTR
ncbi:MAG: M14 family metallopeptidase [Acidimicrobiia bacterium]|nr:M14 family metallopeptidase [Acidimicrobiia bacterium]